MRRLVAVVGIFATLLLAVPAFGQVFVIGPGMVGNPGADDPSVGFSSVALEEQLASAEVTTSILQAEATPQSWDEAWYQLSQEPEV